MTRTCARAWWGVMAAAVMLAPVAAFAQDVAIVNARIVVGNGTVIDSGTIVVRGGRIASVTSGPASTQGLRVIDAKGLSAMPGFIDAHKHINTGPDEKAQMQALLEAGYTTILSGGGPADGNLTLRDHIERGVINGPRIIPSGRIALRNNTPAMMAAVDAGVRLLVHLPNKDWMPRAAAEKLAATGTKVLGTVGFGAPVIDVFAKDDTPRFRDGRPWPASIVDGVRVDGVRARSRIRHGQRAHGLGTLEPGSC
ncbi:MAG TPA: hypothetical protein VG871_06800 [Vicinamibacterales bacterium]|nr:hypothetical protein [Vicinamibacterales bacterium]